MSSNLLSMVQVLSDEKGLEQTAVFEALEIALAAAARREYRDDVDIRVSIDRVSGEYDTFRRWEVIPDTDEEMESPAKQIVEVEAKQRDPKLEVGDFIEQQIPSASIGRISAMTAKQVIMQKVREAERAQIVKEFSSKIGTMVFGQVKRVERGDVIVDIDGVEAVLFKKLSIANEEMKINDRLRAILKEVRAEARGPALVLDRTSPELLVELFKLEVPESREGLVSIIGAAREPGERAKIAVNSDDPKVDPIGACVGVRGARVQAVSKEICGERVDIVRWAANPVQFVINALAPAAVQGMDVLEESRTMNVVVDSDEQLSRAIGTRGQNVRLASELTGWTLNILTQFDAEEKASEIAREKVEHLMKVLDVGENAAEILVQEGFSTLNDIVFAQRETLLQIKEFEDKESLVDEILDRAQNEMLMMAISRAETPQEQSPQDDLLNMDGMDEDTAWQLAGHGIYSMEDLAECDLEDLGEAGISEERAAELIMTARQPWFMEVAVEDETKSV